MNHKPMLAVDCGGLDGLIFPLVISPKLDGVRAVKTQEAVVSRKLLHIPNVRVQALYRDLPDNLDGELLVGSPTAKDVYRKTVSVVMSDDKPVDGLTYHLFDIQEDRPWEERHGHLCSIFRGLRNTAVELVPQVTVYSLKELLEYKALWLGQGYEGLIIRKPGSPYKHGRSTVREGYLLKDKPNADAEAVVIGVTELMHNGNEAKTNALGRTERSHKKEGKTGAGVMGTLVVRDVKTGVEFEIGTGFDAEERDFIWKDWQKGWRGWPLVKYKHFPIGAKDKPRHPVFLGWRDTRDT